MADEAQRQQLLLQAIHGDLSPALQTLLRAPRAGIERGLAAYRSNAGALAERALAAAYPTVRQLISDDSFGALARDFWRQHPPQAGDIGAWGGELVALLAAAISLADEPFLVDVARLEWAVHQAERAADAQAVQGLERLATLDPIEQHLQLSPGTALVLSAHPIVTLWQAHRSDAAGRFEAARAALAAGRGETARITRRGFAVQVDVIDAPTARFTAALLAGRSLGAALDEAAASFDFEAWLIAALRNGQIAAVTRLSA